MGPGRIRTFVAVELDPQVRLRLKEQVDRLRPRLEAAVGPVRWVGQGQYHITLRFLGELLPERLQAVARAVERACGDVLPFQLYLTGLGAFPHLGRPRVLWVGVDEASREQLSRLAHRLNEELDREGFEPAEVPFVPHLTLGRVSQAGSVRQAGVLEALGPSSFAGLGPSRVHEAVVMRSDLHPSGARYTALYRQPLGGTASGGRVHREGEQP